jgi:GWxTD domain-containing protein
MFLLRLLTALTLVQNPQAPLPEFWFDDDDWHHEVQYIVTAEEISAYQQLKTTGERNNFISQFWQRRDPTPGTPQNEFRDEFYRRVEYSNMHFADPNNPSQNGMQTDRGRFYVMFGPPDRVDRQARSFYEFWNYKSLFTVQFSVPPIDSCDGSYRFTSPAPEASFQSGSTSVEIYPMRFITVLIGLDFSKTAALDWVLRTAAGDPVIESDYPVLEGNYGPARGEPFSKHLFGCRLFGTDGMGFTQPVPAGSYTFSTTVTRTDGKVQRETVKFKVD